ncbi:collagen-binding protein [Alloscardovia sp. HMSC034E08]|nr:collagen-binding protein [Alloscardovia sp. HMSC034E08]
MRRPWVRSVGILLATVLAVGLSGGVAQAAGISSWDDVIATVNGLGDGGSTELSIASEITVEDGADPLVVPAGKQVTFTGSGKISGNKSPLFSVEEGGTLTLSGPTFTNVQFSVAGDMSFVSGAIRDTAITGPVIFVNGGTLTISGDAEFSGNNVSDESGKLRPDGVEKQKYSPITAYNGTVRVKGGTLSKNTGLLRGGAIGLWARNGGQPTFEMTGGTLTGNVISHPKYRGRGGAVYGEGTSVNISGGTVQENTTEIGAGLAFINSDVSLSGGVVVQGNNNGDYEGAGGGLFQSGGTLNISGATFTKNVSTGSGGAIYTEGDTKVDIAGAEITSNSASSSGGGIAFNGTTKAVIRAAVLSGNTSNGFWGGGAVYSATKSEVTIYNGLIRGNAIKPGFLIGIGGKTISAQGGGVWNCPTGSTVMHVTRGVGIFDNSVPNVHQDKNGGAGDDFASILKYFGDNPETHNSVVVTERMLGGSPRQWFQDGSASGVHTNWSDGKAVPRYSAEGPHTAIKPNEKVTENMVFKSVPTEDAKAIAEILSTVKITDNVATGTGISGAGIANNGKLTFGDPDPWELKLEKKWDNDDPKDRPDSILVDVKLGDKILETIKLTKENGWKADLTNYPNPSTLIDAKTGETIPLTFIERQVDGYMSHSAVVTENEDTKTIEVEIVNEPVTSVPVEKRWSGDVEADRPGSVTIKLLADGKQTDKSLELTAENGWKGTFTDLPKYVTVDSKKTEIVYTVVEVKVPGYTPSISGSAAEGYVVTNTKNTPPPLARTGSAVQGLVAVGVTLLATGIWAVSKRRRA